MNIGQAFSSIRPQNLSFGKVQGVAQKRPQGSAKEAASAQSIAQQPPRGVHRGEGPAHIKALKQLGGKPTGNLDDDIHLMESLMTEQGISAEELNEKTGTDLSQLKKMAKQGTPPERGARPLAAQRFQKPPVAQQNALRGQMVDAYA